MAIIGRGESSKRKPDGITWEQVFTGALKSLQSESSIKPVVFVDVSFSVPARQLRATAFRKGNRLRTKASLDNHRIIIYKGY